MARYFADVDVSVRVYFDDDGESDLSDQAIEAVRSEISLGELEDWGMNLHSAPELTQ